MNRLYLLILTTALSLSGCVLGPVYVPPHPLAAYQHLSQTVSPVALNQPLNVVVADERETEIVVQGLPPYSHPAEGPKIDYDLRPRSFGNPVAFLAQQRRLCDQSFVLLSTEPPPQDGVTVRLKLITWAAYEVPKLLGRPSGEGICLFEASLDGAGPLGTYFGYYSERMPADPAERDTLLIAVAAAAATSAVADMFPDLERALLKHPRQPSTGHRSASGKEL